MNKKSIKILIGILIVGFVSNIHQSIALILGNLISVFPDMSQQSIQLIYSIIPLAGILGSFLSGMLSKSISKKGIVMISTAIGVLGALLAYIFNSSYYALLSASLIIGLSSNIIRTVALGFGSEYYEGAQLTKANGFVTVSSTIGGAVTSFIAGYLLLSRWQNVYLIFGLYVVVFVAVSVLIPKGNVVAKKKNIKVKTMSADVTFLLLEGFIAGVALITFVGNISIAVTYLDAKYASLSGLSMSLYMLSSGVSAFFIGSFIKIFKKYTGLAGYALLTLSMACLAVSVSHVTVILSAVLFGLGFGLYQPFTMSSIPQMVEPAGIMVVIANYATVMNIGAFIGSYITINLGSMIFGDAFRTRFIIATVLLAIMIAIKLLRSKKRQIK